MVAPLSVEVEKRRFSTMELLQVFKDLRWVSKQYGVHVTLEEIGDYLREEPDYVKSEALLGSFGASTKDGKYNLYEVIYWRNGLDNEERIALNLIMLKQARTTWQMSGKRTFNKGSERSITIRKNGLKMCHVYKADGTRHDIYGRDEALLRAEADRFELEEEQKKLLGIIGNMAPQQLESISKGLTVTIEKERGETQQKGTKKEKKSEVLEEKIVESILTSEPEIKAPTFQEAFKIWTINLREGKKIAPQSVDKFIVAYKRHIESHTDFVNKHIEDITTDDVADIFEAIIRSKVTHIEYNLPKQVIRDTLQYFMSKRKFDYDIKVDFAQVDIEIKSLRLKFKTNKNKLKKKAIGIEQQKEIEETIDYLAYKSCNKKARYYLIKLNFYLGLREAELGALTVDDIDLDRRIVSVNKAEIHYREVDKNYNYTKKIIYEISSTKSENGVRELPLVEEAYEIAKELLDYHARHGYRSKELIYDGEKGPIRRRAGRLSDIYVKIANHMGISTKEFRSHIQRKTFATRLVNDNVEPAEIQEYMGHADIMTTMIYYVLPEKKNLEDRRKTLQSALS